MRYRLSEISFSSPYPFTRVSKNTSGRSIYYTYRFETEDYRYKVFFDILLHKGKKLTMQVDYEAQIKGVNSDYYSMSAITDEGKAIRVMSTIIKMAVEVYELHPEIEAIRYYPSPTDQDKGKGEFDFRRNKLYTAAIKRYLPGSRPYFNGEYIIVDLA